MILRYCCKYKFELNIVSDILVFPVWTFLIVKNYLLDSLMYLSLKIPILNIIVTNDNHWFWGNANGVLDKLLLVGGSIGLIYKFLNFISPRFKRFWRNIRRK